MRGQNMLGLSKGEAFDNWIISVFPMMPQGHFDSGNFNPYFRLFYSSYCEVTGNLF